MRTTDIGIHEKWLGLNEEAGITTHSTFNANALVEKYGPPDRIKLHYDEKDWHLVELAWLDEDGDDKQRFTLTGFSWGYGGEGPNGLATFFKSINVGPTLADIAGWPQKGFSLALERKSGEYSGVRR